MRPYPLPPAAAARLPVARALLAGIALACSLKAGAGAWEVAAPGGLTWRIVEDSTRTRDGYVLERRYADGRADAQFGNGGSVVFALGPDNEGPATLRVDSAGRAWITGASQGPEGLRAVLLRFTAGGLPDPQFGVDGRAAVAPAGAQARAGEVLVLDDGSAWVAGVALDAAGQERSGAWRLRADGSVDNQFAARGLWQDAEAGATAISSIQQAPDGSITIGLRRLAAGQAWLETWAWNGAAATPHRATRMAVNERAMEQAQLQWRGGRWQWIGPTGLVIAEIAPGVAAASAAVMQAAAAAPRGWGAAASAAGSPPGQIAAPVADGRAAPAPEDGRGGWLVWAALALPAAWFGLRHWRRRP